MRIPRPAPGQAKVWILAGIGLVVLTVGAIWWGLASTVGKPSWIDVAWDVKDEHTIEVRYQVSKPPEMTVVCLLEAQASDHSLVGSKEVTLGPTSQAERSYSTTLTTTATAVRGGIRNCREVPAG